MTGPGASPPDRRARIELLVLLAILVLAALARLPGIDARGRWDADQGTDMRVLRGMAVDDELPLLGPKTSIGTFHHGAVYYYLLAPAALASAADPVAVTAEIALFGIAAVAGTWWLARLVGGPLAAALAALLAAVSPAGIDESTFIWNPNLIPAAAALAYAAAIVARRTGRARWWLASGLGAMVVMQCHVLGAVIVVPLGWAWASDLLRRRRAGASTAAVRRGGLGAGAIISAGYLPLLAFELGHGFPETGAIVAYLRGGAGEAAGGVLDRVATVGLRSITWPVAGLITDRIVASLAAALIVTALLAVAVVGRRRSDAPGLPAAAPGTTDLPAARWLVGTLAFSVVALAVFAPSLAIIVPGLPNDHYHAFLDPIVLALAGVGLARLAGGVLASRGRRDAAETGAGRGTLGGGVVAGALTIALVAIAVTAWPPAVSPDGGWPLVDRAAARVLGTTGLGPLLVDGIPSFKNANALAFPLERRGATIVGDPAASGWRSAVVVCDPLFETVVGAACGGPAEQAVIDAAGVALPPLLLDERFDAGPRRVISVYRTTAPP